MAYQPKSYKKFVATAATATLVATAVVPAALADEVSTAAFTDVAPQYKDAVEFVVSQNIAKGKTETRFGISDAIIRGDAAIMVANAAKLNNETAPASGFTDVPTRGALALNSLKAAGVTNGKTPTQFGFNDNITRGEAAIFFANAFKLKADEDTTVGFTDVSDRYMDAVEKLVANGVTSGKSETRFGTADNITRGEFARWLHALEDVINPPEVDPEPKPDPEPVLGHTLEVTFGKSSLVGNGADNTQVTLTVRDENGAVATDADDIVLEVTTSHGSLGQNRVTVQDGVANVTLTSEFTQEQLSAVVQAKLIEAAADSEWHDEIGNLVASGTVTFSPVASEVDESNYPSVIRAETNEADRVTVYFDKPVDPTTFLRYENGRFVTDAEGNAQFLDSSELAASLSIGQDDEDYTIRGMQSVAGNPNALEVILDVVDSEDGENPALTPNAQVIVDSAFTNEFAGAFGLTSYTFNFTDARLPELVDVEVDSMRDLTLEFSEPVTSDYAANAVITVDGQPVTVITDGEFNQNGSDLRHEITVRTNEFLTAGTHSVQVSGVEDYAGNVISNESLDFVIPVNNTAPAATVQVESPEQVRLTWNHEVAGFSTGDVNFQYWLPNTDENDDLDGEWVDFPDGVEFLPTTIDAGLEYVYELNTDWTRFVDTLYDANPDLDSSNFDYTNFEVRATVDSETVTSEINGLENARQVLSLNYEGSPLNEFDTTSPVISDDIVRYFDNDGVEQGYIVTFDEPVKAPRADVADTPSVRQGDTIPEVVVEFRGTDADGNRVVIDGMVRGYAPDHPAIDEDATSADDALLVRAIEADLQELVDDEDYSSEWTLVIRNVTDDVGNAATTGIERALTIAPTPAPAEVFAVFTSAHNGVVFGDDTITLDFSAAVQFTGNTGNALNLANYTLNGAALPAGSSVALSADNTSDSPIDVAGGDLSIVTITLPEGTLDATNNVINVSEELVSRLGTEISGVLEITQDQTETPE